MSDVYQGLAKGLKQCGADVGMFNLDDRMTFYAGAHVKRDDEWVQAFDGDTAAHMAAIGLEAVLYEWWPDVVIVVSGFFIPPKIWAVLKMRPHTVVYWATESPYEDDRQARPARYADLVVLNDPKNLEQFRAEVNPQTHYFPHSYDPQIHHGNRNVPTWDFGFVGTGFPSRVEFFEDVTWPTSSVALAGNWQFVDDDSPIMPFLLHERGLCMDNKDTAEMYRSVRVSANLYRKETSEAGTADGWAMGPREVELAATGTFFLREPRGEGDELFPMLPTFTEVDEFSDLLAWALTHPDECTTAAAAARAAIGARTFKNTAARLLRMVDGVRAFPAAA